MLSRIVLCLLPASLLGGAPSWVLIRAVDGTRIEGQADIGRLACRDVLSVHNGAPASASETERITAGLAAIQGADRAARDQAVEELTAIGLPVLTPLLKALKDTDQHEPRPLYRLFERIIPSSQDGFDRSLSLIRCQDGAGHRGQLPAGAIKVRVGSGETKELPWAEIRTLAVRRNVVTRAVPVHSLRHCTEIEYLDSGIVLGAASKVTGSATGFVRLSWNEDGWATDPDGLKKPGSPAYKSNLVNGHPFGALVGRTGATGELIFLGRRFSKQGLAAGRLQLAVNDNAHRQNNLGTFTVTLTATDAYDLGDPQ